MQVDQLVSVSRRLINKTLHSCAGRVGKPIAVISSSLDIVY